MFEFTAGDLINLRRFYKRAPKMFGRAVVGMLNNVAFEARVELLKTIGSQMNIRNPRFVAAHMKVQKAKGSDISRAVSVVGSVGGARFTGWVEQETGQTDTRNRVYGLFARGGDENKKVSVGRTRKTSNRILRMSDFDIDNAVSDQHRVVIFLQMIDQQKRGKMFWIRRNYKKLKGSTVYNMAGRRKRRTSKGSTGSSSIRRVSTDKPMGTRKDPWMQPTIRKTVTTATMRNAWARSINFQLARRK